MMRTTSLAPILGELPVPQDYPAEAHLGVHGTSEALFQRSSTAGEIRKEFRNALNAVALRFCTAADSSDALSQAVLADGDGPANPARYRQERLFFEFITTGIAAVETFCYAAYVIGHVVSDRSFPLSSEKDRRRIAPSTTIEGWRLAGGKDLADELQAVYNSTQFSDWKIYRNVLSHRGHPGRQFFLSVGSSAAAGAGTARYDDFAGTTGPDISPDAAPAMRAWMGGRVTLLMSQLKTTLGAGD
jgi:hypothetical protein